MLGAENRMSALLTNFSWSCPALRSNMVSRNILDFLSLKIFLSSSFLNLLRNYPGWFSLLKLAAPPLRPDK
jgi:hypothetical protein